MNIRLQSNKFCRWNKSFNSSNNNNDNNNDNDENDNNDEKEICLSPTSSLHRLVFPLSMYSKCNSIKCYYHFKRLVNTTFEILIIITNTKCDSKKFKVTSLIEYFLKRDCFTNACTLISQPKKNAWNFILKVNKDLVTGFNSCDREMNWSHQR